MPTYFHILHCHGICHRHCSYFEECHISSRNSFSSFKRRISLSCSFTRFLSSISSSLSDKAFLGVWDASEERWKEVIAKFWGYITLIDDAIGEFVKFLKEEGLYESLFMAITADHGDAMGAHRIIEKGEFMFDTTYRIPMIIKDPCSNRKNEEDNNFVYLHDLTPTCNDVAGKNISGFFDGESLLPILREGKSNGRKGVLGQLAGHFVYFEQRMWRREDYKIIFNASDVGELYDMKNDKEEMNNLFYDEKYKNVKKEMLEELYSEMVKLKDPLAGWLYRIIYEI